MQQNDYIVIVAEFPDKKNEKDGMIQRELAIDFVFSDIKRIYLDLRQSNYKFLKYPKKWILNKIYKCFNKLDCFKNNKVKLFNFLSNKKLYKLFENARIIYFHSIYNLTLIPQELIEKFVDKIIIDIHGCVVEELIYYEQEKKIVDKFQKFENEFFPKVKALISVSNNMIDFYKNKYPNINTKFINLPIFNRFKINDNIINSKKNINIIYSGGSQKWQNVDIMIDSISKIANNYKVTLLTPDISVFSEKLKKYKNLLEKIEIKTVPSNLLYQEYEKADYGYILRDDIIVNKVACPTKIIEYLNYGIIPIVLQPEIGDFNNLGYSYITNDNLILGNIPNSDELKKMRLKNMNIINTLSQIREKGEQDLLNLYN